MVKAHWSRWKEVSGASFINSAFKQNQKAAIAKSPDSQSGYGDWVTAYQLKSGNSSHVPSSLLTQELIWRSSTVGKGNSISLSSATGKSMHADTSSWWLIKHSNLIKSET